MARKTKAELIAEYKEAQAAQEAQQLEQYPTRLMQALEEATTANNFELTVRNGAFYLHDRDNPADPPTLLPLAYARDNLATLESLEWILQAAASERVLAGKLATARKAALAKLTPQEQAWLGLTP